MKKVFDWLKDYYKTEFSFGVVAFTCLVLTISIWINYTWDFEAVYVYGLKSDLATVMAYMAFYGLPWGLILFASLWQTGDFSALRNPRFLGMAVFALLIISINGWFPYHADLARDWLGPETRYFGRKIFWNIKNSAVYIPPLLIWWWYFDRKDPQMARFYGVTLKNFSLWPYLLMLGIVFPLVVWASFQPDFLNHYPQYRPSRAEDYLGVPFALTSAFFELIYGLDFFSTELFFRGFLVIGMAKFLGKKAILPMVGMYCFLHFGKPMGEAISSIFGGWILGIIAYYGRSVFGGVLIHMGVAWCMEATALYQLFR